MQVKTTRYVKTVDEYGDFGPDQLTRIQKMIDRAMSTAKGWKRVPQQGAEQ